MNRVYGRCLGVSLALLALFGGCSSPTDSPPKSSNADLSALTIDSGTLTPAFSAAVTAYTVSVDNAVTQVTVQGTAANSAASVSPAVTLSGLVAGTAQTATITVTAQNGNTKSYTVAVTRQQVYSVTYSGNGSAGGSPPSDATSYSTGQSVTVLANTGSLVKTGTAFVGWNTLANGTGTTYAAGQTFPMGNANVVLYALWNTVVYDGNGNTGGLAPIANILYLQGDTVTLPSNSGNLVKTGYTFAGWSTLANGSGTFYSPGQTFTNGSGITTLYAKWILATSVASAGANYTMLVKSDGTLWATGYNGYGQLGDGTTTSKSSPVQVMTDVAAVSVSDGGNYSTLIVKTDGTLWATGYNASGQLGDGTKVNKSTPVQIMTSVASVSVGHAHTMILRTNGTLFATGSNGLGELGDGTTTDKSTPVQIMTGVASVAAAGQYTMIIKTDGTLWAVGSNASGQLGDGTTTNRLLPVQIMTGVRSVSARADTTMILKTDGTLWATGNNSMGQLGDGTSTTKTTPVQVMTDVSAVSPGSNRHTLVVKTDGSLWAMGDNTKGQFGNGATSSTLIATPVQVMTGVSFASAGSDFSMIVKTDGSLWATGANTNGQLGIGNATSKSTPVQVVF